jgi:hypothetical protein
MRWRRLSIVIGLAVLVACGGHDGSGAARAVATTTTTTAIPAPSLPRTLPASGLAEWYDGGTRLRAFDGSLLAELPHADLGPNVPSGPLYVFVSDPADVRHGRWLRLDAAHARWIDDTPPPEPGADVPLPAVPPGRALTGHWRWAVPSPRRDVRLAQWSGECEVPAAFFVGADGVPHSVLGGDWLDAPNTSAIGWLPDGRALVDVAGPEAGCGRGSPEPGVYAIDPHTFERTRFAAVTGEPAVAWG